MVAGYVRCVVHLTLFPSPYCLNKCTNHMSCGVDVSMYGHLYNISMYVLY